MTERLNHILNPQPNVPYVAPIDCTGKYGTAKPYAKEANCYTHTNWREASSIVEDCESGMSVRAVARKTGRSRSTVGRIMAAHRKQVAANGRDYLWHPYQQTDIR